MSCDTVAPTLVGLIVGIGSWIAAMFVSSWQIENDRRIADKQFRARTRRERLDRLQYAFSGLLAAGDLLRLSRSGRVVEAYADKIKDAATQVQFLSRELTFLIDESIPSARTLIQRIQAWNNALLNVKPEDEATHQGAKFAESQLKTAMDDVLARLTAELDDDAMPLWLRQKPK